MIFIFYMSRMLLPAPSGGSAFADILKYEVLDGTNYMDWKQIVDMLGFYGCMDIICIDQPLVKPAPVTEQEGWNKYEEILKTTIIGNWQLMCLVFI